MRGPVGAGAGRQSPQPHVLLPHRLRGAAPALRVQPRPKVAALLQPCPKTLLLHTPCTAAFNSELARVKYFSLPLRAVACLAAQSSWPLGSPGPRDCPGPCSKGTALLLHQLGLGDMPLHLPADHSQPEILPYRSPSGAAEQTVVLLKPEKYLFDSGNYRPSAILC